MAMSLKAARVNAKLTQRDAAKKLGITIQSLSHYETGKRVPNIFQARDMATLYGVPIDEIIF